MIYIDPPYNTGKDFVYNDNFRVSSDEWKTVVGDYSDEVNKLVINTHNDGPFHTNWLNMIYPRLICARDLLSDNGMIFISIDDNELPNLLKVCDHVFGSSNRVGDIIRKTKSQTNDSSSGLNYQHEFVIIYAKDSTKALLKGELKDFSNYKNPDNDASGAWVIADPSARSGGENGKFPITNPYTGTVDYPPQGRYWAFSQKTFDEWVKRGKIQFRKEVKAGERGFIVKKYLAEVKSQNNPVNSLFAVDNAYMNQAATKEMNDLMPEVSSDFVYPKPVVLLSKLIEYATENGDIVMDFFSGTATTVHGILNASMADKKNRTFIVVQYPEKLPDDSEAYSRGFKTICDIGEERIRRAGSEVDMDSIDSGFRVFKIDSSNMNDVFYNPNALKKNILDYVADNIKSDRTTEDLLFQVMLELGIELSASIVKSQIGGRDIFNVDDGYLIACFDENINDDVVTAIAKQQPRHVVFRDSSMANDAVAINFEQIFKAYSPNTQTRVL